MVKFNVGTLESVMVGLIVVFAIISIFAGIAGDLASAIGNITGGSNSSASIAGGAIFGIVGFLIVVGLLLVIMKGLMGKR